VKYESKRVVDTLRALAERCRLRIVGLPGDLPANPTKRG
jgi:hypothetical protein